METQRGRITGGPFRSPNPNDGAYQNQRWEVQCKCGRKDIVAASAFYCARQCVECAIQESSRPRLLIEYKGTQYTIAEACRIAGVCGDTLRRRRRLGRDLLAAPSSKWVRAYGKTLKQLADERGITKEGVRQRILRYGSPDYKRVPQERAKKPRGPYVTKFTKKYGKSISQMVRESGKTRHRVMAELMGVNQ
jgi:transposase-like protein